ncbi:hypothetical protein ABEF92_004104 [Exophiala dermatitidis]|uniref:Uncharacterized protein n=1 Tax=Exophiala dermatitidis (strain ATCC 34100 / CBS 525.76 / NIH/UT8656) TaxID=858893 RepID=H6BRD6_EXODN|nr:uncharacterized protein HMPREF1120_02882 [Exophiala dermatitidis NIH/UT8656]EHY54717.1 hypothetical protein HMPREF1120_02882 [Exophiala dermatitidis NIH/UT8656]
MAGGEATGSADTGTSTTGAASTDTQSQSQQQQGQQQGEGSFPLAAQISLKEFQIPDFPSQASRLRQLTLTADIKLDEYQGKVQIPDDAVVTQPPLPNLPQSITHLNLELFGLGFPGKPPFLGRLARSLPNLSSVTFFSCLIDGLDDHSRKDAEAFFRLLPNLQELHLIDSFARPGFFETLGKILEERASASQQQDKDSGGGGGLKVVNVSYTFRGHEDSDFLARVHGAELPKLIVKGVVGASFDFVPEAVDELAEEEDKDGDQQNGNEGEGEEKKKKKENIAEGILPFASDGRAPAALKKRFEDLREAGDGALQSLRVLNLGMWSLRPAEVGEIVVKACAGGSGGKAGLADLTVSVLLEENWIEEFIKGFGEKDNGTAPDLEGIEVIGVPSNANEVGEGEDGPDWKQGGGLSLVKLADVQRLNEVCPRLGKFGMSILKVKSAPNVLFFKEGESWTQQ